MVRVPDPDDGRSYRLTLTEDGRMAHGLAAERFLPVLAAVTAEIGDQGPEILRRLGSLHRVITDRRCGEF